MKNYSLRKFLIARTGLIVVSNQFGQRWIEIRANGKLVRQITIRKEDTWRKQDLKVLRKIANLHLFPEL